MVLRTHVTGGTTLRPERSRRSPTPLTTRRRPASRPATPRRRPVWLPPPAAATRRPSSSKRRNKRFTRAFTSRAAPLQDQPTRRRSLTHYIATSSIHYYFHSDVFANELLGRSLTRDIATSLQKELIKTLCVLLRACNWTGHIFSAEPLLVSGVRVCCAATFFWTRGLCAPSNSPLIALWPLSHVFEGVHAAGPQLTGISN